MSSVHRKAGHCLQILTPAAAVDHDCRAPSLLIGSDPHTASERSSSSNVLCTSIAGKPLRSRPPKHRTSHRNVTTSHVQRHCWTCWRTFLVLDTQSCTSGTLLTPAGQLVRSGALSSDARLIQLKGSRQRRRAARPYCCSGSRPAVMVASAQLAQAWSAPPASLKVTEPFHGLRHGHAHGMQRFGSRQGPDSSSTTPRGLFGAFRCAAIHAALCVASARSNACAH